MGNSFRQQVIMYLQQLKGNEVAHLLQEAGILTLGGVFNGALAGTWFAPTEFPPRDEEEAGLEVSDTVMIDIDGSRSSSSYVLGFYNFTHKQWVSKDEGVRLNSEDFMLWTLLPLAKYELKK